MFQQNTYTIRRVSRSIQCYQTHLTQLDNLSFIERLMRIKSAYFFAYINCSSGSISNLYMTAHKVCMRMRFNNTDDSSIMLFCVIIIGLRVTGRINQNNLFLTLTQYSITIMGQTYIFKLLYLHIYMFSLFT